MRRRGAGGGDRTGSRGVACDVFVDLNGPRVWSRIAGGVSANRLGCRGKQRLCIVMMRRVVVGGNGVEFSRSSWALLAITPHGGGGPRGDPRKPAAIWLTGASLGPGRGGIRGLATGRPPVRPWPVYVCGARPPRAAQCVCVDVEPWTGDEASPPGNTRQLGGVGSGRVRPRTEARRTGGCRITQTEGQRRSPQLFDTVRADAWRGRSSSSPASRGGGANTARR